MMPFPVSRLKFALLIVCLFFPVVCFLLFNFGYFLISSAEKNGQDQVFVVEGGATLNTVARQLHTKGIIAHKGLFKFWTRLMGYSRNIKAGEYGLSSRMNPLMVLAILSKGIVISHPVTFPEGFTLRQIGEILEEKGLVRGDEFLSLAKDPDLAAHYGFSGSSLEGYLYPDTYRFGRGLSSMQIIDVMVRHFFDVIAAYRKKAEQAGMTIEEVVTLASIVEKETGRAEERPLIASVFLNRLKKKSRLESDPTVIYGLTNFNGNLTKKDLTKATPYNTYVIRGLPPGPISNPGEEAIKAVLYPAKTEYMYFVSKNDGSHHFSKTFAEHNRAVKFYQKNKHNRKGKKIMPN